MVTAFQTLLAHHRLVAILRGRDEAATAAAALALLDEGVQLLEISLSGHRASAAIRTVVEQAPPGCSIGAGTVLTPEQARGAAEAGAQFVVTPGLCPAVAEARRLGMPVIAGALTPTEVIAAAAQADAVKLFPASLGGPEYLAALRAPFPDVAFVPVGGIDAERAGHYLALGAAAVGVGSPLIGDAADGGDLTALRGRARDYLAAVSR